ncbi:MAG: hypothetical protein P4L84_35550 [Isosphaeraceae bacterium]|nr:hypothetical protein [Isosphaeraceae bacterium]
MRNVESEPVVERGASEGRGTLRALAGREVRLEPLLDVIVRRQIGIIIGIGIFFRVARYLASRPLWLDEVSLALNFGPTPWTDLFGPLANAQLAPAGFLMVEWVAVRILGFHALAMRLFPLVCGIASLFLFTGVARRCLRPEAVSIGLGLFAVSDDMIYYSSELKPYATDVALGLACLLGGFHVASRPLTKSRLAGFAALGVSAVWLSFPAAFVLAGVGTVLIVSALRQQMEKRALGLTLASLAWTSSFAGVYATAVRQLGGNRPTMWAFWDFAFPRLPPATVWEAGWAIRRLLYLFVNPLDFATPLGPWSSAVAALGFFLVGCACLRPRDPRAFWMVLSPILFALLAGYLHLYPFHGRLILFVVPLLLLLIGEGAWRIVERFKDRRCRAAALLLIFCYPVLFDIAHMVETRDRFGLPVHGDRRPPALELSEFPF